MDGRERKREREKPGESKGTRDPGQDIVGEWKAWLALGQGNTHGLYIENGQPSQAASEATKDHQPRWFFCSKDRLAGISHYCGPVIRVIC